MPIDPPTEGVAGQLFRVLGRHENDLREVKEEVTQIQSGGLDLDQYVTEDELGPVSDVDNALS